MTPDEAMAKLAETEEGKAIAEVLAGASTGLAAQLAEAKALAQANDEKAGRILAEKKAAAEKLAELETKAAAASTAGQTKDERFQAELTAAQSRADNAMKALDELKGELQAKDRAEKIQTLATDLRFVPNVTASTQKVLVDAAFDGVDLADQIAVDAVMTKFKDENKPFLQAADVASGAGSVAGQVAPGANNAEAFQTKIDNMSPEDFKAQEKELWLASGAA